MPDLECATSAKKKARKRKRNRGNTTKSAPKKRKKTTEDAGKNVENKKGVSICSYCKKVFTDVLPGSTAWNVFSNHVRSCRIKKNANQALLAGQKLPLKDMVLGITTFGASNYETTKEIICKLGGRVSNSIHKRVAFVVGTPAAITQNTQRVRKACKYKIPIVTTSFLQHAEETGLLPAVDEHRLVALPQKTKEKKKKKSEKTKNPTTKDIESKSKPEPASSQESDKPMTCYCICHDPDCPPHIEIPCPYCVDCGG